MAFTPEARAKARAKIAENKAKRDAAKAAHIEVASIKGTAPEDVTKLLAEIADLKSKLQISETGRSEAEKAALLSAEAQGQLMQRAIEEVPTGKFVTVKRLDPKDPYKVVGHKDDGRDILRPNFVDVKLPTFFYKIDMPPCGGLDLKLNGTPFYHGTVYEFDLDTLRAVKDIVYRTWKHDADIHGSDENFYRKPTSPVLSGARMGR